MSAWLIPQRPISEQARAYRQRWADRWGALNPPFGFDHPEGALYTHLHAYPEFRSPLSPGEEAQASAEFHLAAIRRMARGHPVTVLTFDWGWQGDGGGSETSQTEIAAQDRDWWLSYLEDPDDPDQVIMHAFRTEMLADDPRLAAMAQSTAIGNLAITVTDPDLNWILRPHEECVALHSFDAVDLTLLEAAEHEIRAHWGIQSVRWPVLDLAAVAAEFVERRGGWERSGVTVDTEPQYRSWEGERIEILDRLPDDVGSVDWFLVGLSCGSAEAQVIVFDTGTCQVVIDPDSDDPDSEVIHEYRRAPGSHDLVAVVATFERVVATLQESPTAEEP